MKKFLPPFFSCLVLLIPNLAFAQKGQIQGTVTSSVDDRPLVGANVQLLGESQGTITDAAGAYTIEAGDTDSLVFSFIGMASKTIGIDNRSIIDVSLDPDTRGLSEVVVTGYGQQIKRDLTGNIAKISGTDITNIPSPSIESALQGRAAGVVINQGSGKLGQGIQVRVRGASSLSASSQPLYVVDGIPVTSSDQSSFGGATNPLADINFNDVESVEVLKDASASAIYGSRAANGVVLITTKKGKEGATSFNINYQYGVSNPTRRVPFLSAGDYVNFYRVAAMNSDAIEEIDPSDPSSYTAYMESFFETNSLGTFNSGVNEAMKAGEDFRSFVQDVSQLRYNTDWQDQVFVKNAPTQQVDLTLSGGTGKTTFYVSGQYFDQDGIIIGNKFNRLSGRLNLDHKVSDFFELGLSMSIARSLNERLADDNAFSNPLQSVALVPLSPAIDPETNLPIGTPPGNAGIPNYYNPRINVGNAQSNQVVIRNLSSGYLQLNLLPSLRFRSELGVDLLSQEEERYFNSKTSRLTAQPNGDGSSFFTGVYNYNTNNYFTYNTDWSQSVLDVTLGMSYQASQTKSNSVSGINFPSDAYKYIVSAGTINGGTSGETNFRFLSYFLRANYKLLDKYLISASGRVDGSSRFGRNSRYGFFPSASVGWILTEENFLKDNSFLSFLKLRASYGLTGNAEISNFPSLGLYSAANYAGSGGQAPTQLGNEDLKWETTAQFDVGLDFGFFGNRVHGEVDYYIKNTNDLLLNVNIPSSTGFRTLTRNAGALQNKGFELVINSENLTGELQWSTNLNLAINQNKITRLEGDLIEGGIQNMSRAVVGEPIGTFFTTEYAGVDPANGDALYYMNTEDSARVTTNDYNRAQRVVVGSAIPTLTGGITNNLSYKGVDFSVFFNGVAGNKINLYGLGQYGSANGIYEDNQTADQKNAWTETNTNTNVPQARLFYSNGNQASTRYIQDGAYLRLRTLTLGYTFPGNISKALKINSLRLYLTAHNLFTFTKYSGWDPEVNSDAFTTNIALGYDFYTPPMPKTFMAGVNIKF